MPCVPFFSKVIFSGSKDQRKFFECFEFLDRLIIVKVPLLINIREPVGHHDTDHLLVDLATVVVEEMEVEDI